MNTAEELINKISEIANSEHDNNSQPLKKIRDLIRDYRAERDYPGKIVIP